jgi:hypothetical protein
MWVISIQSAYASWDTLYISKQQIFQTEVADRDKTHDLYPIQIFRHIYSFRNEEK